MYLFPPRVHSCVDHLTINQKRNETIEGMVAAHRENETRMARFKLGELGQVGFVERRARD